MLILQYDGGRTTADFVKFLNEKAGTQRLPGGKLSDQVRSVHYYNKLYMYNTCPSCILYRPSCTLYIVQSSVLWTPMEFFKLKLYKEVLWYMVQ